MSRKGAGIGVVTAGLVMLLMWLVTAPSPRLFNQAQLPLHMPRMAKPQLPPDATSGPTATTTRTLEKWEGDRAAMNQSLAIFWTVAAAVVLLAALIALAVWAYRTVTAIRREAVLDETDVELMPEVPDALVHEPESLRAALRAGEARNAIVQCWARLEDATRDAGVPMAAHETSSEYTQRVVTVWVSEPTALERLAGLYRTARFSRHPMGESDRAAAATALEDLLADLRRTWEVRHGER